VSGTSLFSKGDRRGPLSSEGRRSERREEKRVPARPRKNNNNGVVKRDKKRCWGKKEGEPDLLKRGKNLQMARIDLSPLREIFSLTPFEVAKISVERDAALLRHGREKSTRRRQERKKKRLRATVEGRPRFITLKDIRERTEKGNPRC